MSRGPRLTSMVAVTCSRLAGAQETIAMTRGPCYRPAGSPDETSAGYFDSRAVWRNVEEEVT